MGWGRSAGLGALTCALAASSAIVGSPAAAGSTSSSRATDATVTVLHAIPAGLGADVVDVYAGSTLLVDDLEPGKLTTIKVPRGTYDLAVLPDGRSPGSTAPLASAPTSRIPAGANLTVAAHLTAAGRPAVTVFTNDTSTVGRGKGRLTVRHVAAAPPVDVRSAGSVLLSGLRNPREANVGLNAGTYRIDAVRAGTRTVVLRPTSVTIRNSPGTQDMGTNTILYIWGSEADGSLRQAVQNVRIDLR
jgi:hypothetical protein